MTNNNSKLKIGIDTGGDEIAFVKLVFNAKSFPKTMLQKEWVRVEISNCNFRLVIMWLAGFFQLDIKKMSVVGLDFGSHAASIALWYEGTDKVEVIADDLGFRTIPCAVAYRAGEDEVEVLTGQAAITQSHKNPKNTFLDVRSLLENESVQSVHVPALDKEVSVAELASHFFRNVHNQIKQQVGKPVRECVVSVPASMGTEGPLRTRLMEAAQMGGCRIKSTISDSAAVLNAHGFDNENKNPQIAAVVDIGFSRTEVHIYFCTGGLYFLKGQASTKDISGAALVKALSAHCSKDFLRRAKVPCEDNLKSMTRLRNECENCMKALSTNNEATIDLDSLCEGIDYSTKISRARFEDLGTIPFMQLRNCLQEAVTKAGLKSAADVTKVLLAGGLSGVPKCAAVISSFFETAEIQRSRGLEFSEAAAVGAALQGRALVQTGLLESPPAVNSQANAPCMNSAVFIRHGTSAPVQVLPAGSVLPAHFELTGACPAAGGSVGVFVEANQVGELVFVPTTQAEQEAVKLVVSVGLDGVIVAEAHQPSTGLVLASLTI